MIDDVRARLASIEQRFGSRTVQRSTPPSAQNGVAFQQILGSLGPTGGPTTLGQLLESLTTAVPGASRPEQGPPGSVPSGAAHYRSAFAAAGARYGVDPELLAAVAWTESGFNADAVSHAGAIGLMQIMPGTAEGLGVDPRDPLQAIDGAARYLRTQLNRFGSVELALAAYNAGPGAVERHSGIPPYEETTTYVSRVLGRYDELRYES